MSFADFKKKSNTLETLSKELEKLNAKTNFKDERFWRCERDKTGNGFAVIRFLPAPEGEDNPFVKIFSHNFKSDTGKYFIHNCPTTLGRDCCVCRSNTELWNTNTNEKCPLKSIARTRKRKLEYISNILVISDPANKENEGKVFLFRYGKKIMDKIIESMKPTNPTKKPINPFDMWTGRNFEMTVKTVKDGNFDFPNYDSSQFDASDAISTDDTALEKLWKSEYKLLPFIAPDQFKSDVELTALFNAAIGETNTSPRSSTQSKQPFKKPAENDDTPPFTSDGEDTDVDDYLARLSKE